MAYQKITTIKGRKYAYLVESHWDPEKKQSRQRVLRYLGPVDDSGPTPKVRAPRTRVETVDRVLSIGGPAAYWAVATALHVRSIAGQVLGDARSAECLVALAFNQALHRRSLVKAPEWLNQASPLPAWLGCEPFEREELEATLSRICHEDAGVVRDAGATLQRELAKEWRRAFTKQPAEAYYDITKVPYHGDACSLAERGYALGRRGGASIGVGLVVSRKDAFPILCRPLPGSRKDASTLPDVLHLLEGEGFRKDEITLVIDRGIVSKENLALAKKSRVHILGGCPATSDDAKRALRHFRTEDLARDAHAIRRPSDEVVYARGWTGRFLGVTGRFVLVFNAVRCAKEASERDGMLAEYRRTTDPKRLEELRTALGTSLFKPSQGRRGFALDEEALAREREVDGRFVLFTTRKDLSDEDVFRLYFQKDEIEKAFRSLKGEVRLGPVRFRRPERINAYLTVVFVAYLLRAAIAFKLREAGLDVSVDEALDTLSSWNQVEFTSTGNQKVRWLTKTTKAQDAIKRALGIDEAIPRG